MALKILLLTHRIPYPLNDGGALGVHYFIKGYTDQQVEVSLLSMNTTKHFVEVQNLPAIYKKLSLFETVYIDNSIKPLDAFFNLFSKKSYNIQRFESAAFDYKLQEILQNNQYDIVQFDNIYLQKYLPTVKKWSKAKNFCRIHNIEHAIWQQLAKNTKNIFKKKYLNLMANRLQKEEYEALASFDLLLSINQNDEDFLRKINKNIYNFPFGIDIDIEKSTSILPKINTVFHIGSMDWQPNAEGVHWLCTKIMPLVLKKNPAIVLHLAGKNMPTTFAKYASKNIVLHGEVENANVFIQEYNIMLVPILSGAGIRVKILEALAANKTIISTSLGASGIDVTDKKNICIANTEQAFANAIVQLANTEAIFGNEPQKLVENKYQQKTIFANAIAYFQQLISN